MKKRRLLPVVILLCALCLAGCARQAGSPADAQGGAQGSADGGAADTGKRLELVTPTTGLFFASYSGNENGTYLVENTGKDYSGYLTYYDYGSLQKIYLSPQLDVTFDEQNPGWIDDLGGGAFPIATDDALYVYICGLNSETSATYEDHPARLLKMQPNGADRQEIVFSGNYDVQLGSAVATDGDELYFLATRFQPKTGVIEATVLLKSDFRSGQMVEVCEVSGGVDALIIGVCDEGFVIQNSVDDMTYGFSVLSAAGEEKSVPFTWNIGESSRIVYGGKLMVCDAATGIVTAYDFASGETSDLLGLGGSFDPSSEMMYILTDGYDGRLTMGVFEAVAGEEAGGVGAVVKRFSVDIETGETKDFTLTGIINNSEQYVEIFSETEEDFLVAYGDHSADVIGYAPGGSEYIYSTNVLDFALIDKDDYWNSVPDYRPFADAR